MRIVFLPATAPGDPTYGTAEAEWPRVQGRFADAVCCAPRFDSLVWYNREVRAETFAQLSALCDDAFDDTILVGFSKSGCGALNLALDHPGLFGTVIVFDAPLCNEDPRRFDMRRFYPDAEALRPDVPMLRIRAGETVGASRLVLVSGEGFAGEMAAFAAELRDRRLPVTVHADTRYPHHWNAGWLLPALIAVDRNP